MTLLTLFLTTLLYKRILSDNIYSVTRTVLPELSSSSHSWLYISYDDFQVDVKSSSRCNYYGATCTDPSCYFCDCPHYYSFISEEDGCKTASNAANDLRSSICFYVDGFFANIPTIKTTANIIKSTKLLKQDGQPTGIDTSNVNCFPDSLLSFNNDGYFVEELPMDRTIQYFYIDNKFIGDKILMWNITASLIKSYQGRLMKLKLRCYDINKEYIESCFIFKVEGMHLVKDDTETTTTMSTTTETTTTSTITTSTTTTTTTTTDLPPVTSTQMTTPVETTSGGTKGYQVGKNTDDGNNNIGLIAGVVVGVIILILIIIAVVVYTIKKKKNVDESRQAWNSLDEPPRTDSGASQRSKHTYATTKEVSSKDTEYQTLDFRSSAPAYEYVPVKEKNKENETNIYYSGNDEKISGIKNPLYGQPSVDNEDEKNSTTNETSMNPIYHDGEIYAECSES